MAGQVAIVTPRNGEAIQDSEGRVPLTLSTSLIPGEKVRILLNGIAVQTYGEGERLLLLNVDRGEHRLEAEVIDDKGSVVATSVPVTFNVIRVTAVGPGRGAPPAPVPPVTSTLVPSNPADTTGKPDATNPPGSIGAPSTVNPPTAVGASNPNNPASSVGTPGTPGPNNPAATVGRPPAR
jgi:hypothetical protein